MSAAQTQAQPAAAETSSASAVSAELASYERHLADKQRRSIAHFEETARSSREGVLQDESARVMSELASAGVDTYSAKQQHDAHMREFETKLDGEIEEQRRQLMENVAANRIAKLEAYRADLNRKMASFDQQAQAAQQPAAAAPQTNPASTSSAAASSSSSLYLQPAAASAPVHAPAPVPASSAAAASAAQDPASQRVEAQRQYMREAQRAIQEQQQKQRQQQEQQQQQQRQQQEEEQEQQQRQAQQQQQQQQQQHAHEQQLQQQPYSNAPFESQPHPSHSLFHSHHLSPPAAYHEVHSHHSATHTSPHRSDAAYPTPATQGRSMTQGPQQQQPAFLAGGDGDPLLQRWKMLKQELHGPPVHSHLAAVTAPPPAPYHSTHAYQHASAPHVSSSSSLPSSSAAADAQHTFRQVEHALELDWAGVWEEGTQAQLMQQQRQQRMSTAHHAHHPAPTPMSDRRSQVAFGTSPRRSPPSQHQAPQLPYASPSAAPPVQVLHQANNLFKSTLHELEEKAQYLHTLIAAFKDAGRDMDQTVMQQQEMQQHQHHQQPLEQQYEAEADYDDAQEAYQDEEAEYDSGLQYGAPRAFQPALRGSVDQSQQRASRPRVAFAPSAGAPKMQRARSASQVRPRSASLSRPVNGTPAPRKSLQPAAPASAVRRPASASVARPVAAAAAPTQRTGASSVRRASSGISAPPAAMSYPRARTASARAARASAPPGVAQAQARIRAIVAKTRPSRPRAVNAITHPNAPRPSMALVADDGARIGLRQASVQEVLQGAGEIIARKAKLATPASATARPRSAQQQASRVPLRASSDPADEYEFQPSTDEHPRHPLSVHEAARMQAAAAARLSNHPVGAVQDAHITGGYPALHAPHRSPPPSHAGAAPRRSNGIAPTSMSPSSFDPADEFGRLLAEPEPSLLDDSLLSAGAADPNSAAGLAAQEAAAQSRHNGHLEAYLRALAQPAASEERRVALAQLAGQSPPSHIYASPLRTHSPAAYQQRAQQQAALQQRERMSLSFRSDACVRGSKSSDLLPPQSQQQRGSGAGGIAALEQIMMAHHAVRH